MEKELVQYVNVLEERRLLAIKYGELIDGFKWQADLLSDIIHELRQVVKRQSEEREDIISTMEAAVACIQDGGYTKAMNILIDLVNAYDGN